MKANRIIVLIALIFLLANVKCIFAQADYKIAEQDSLALVAFYNATDGPNWISNQDGFGLSDLSSEWQGVYEGGFNKWLDGPVKDWFGVTVEKVAVPNTNEFAYRVVRVWPVIGRRTDGQNNIKGYIPREIGLLTALREFRINGNNGFINTEIPDEIYHKSFQHFDIESCWFEGDISDALRNCTDLRKMNFRYNYINYLPTLDFLDKDGLYNLQGTQWMYSTQIPLANFEKSIDYFYTISENPKEFGMEMRDVNNVGEEIEIVAPLGTSVEMECTAAGEKEDFITYQWLKNGLSKFGKTKRLYSITSVKESDYADYTVKITNEYVKAYDGNSNWGEVYTKAIHLVAEPVAPVIQWAKTSYNGKALELRFTKPMPNAISGLASFTVTSGGNTINVISSSTKGRLNRDVFFELDETIGEGEDVVLNYSGSSVSDKNGGLLETVSGLLVENLVRKAPVFVEARTTKDGNGVEVIFDNYIDPNSIDISNFSIKGESDYTIIEETLVNGEIDRDISKTILLTLSQAVTDNTEELSISYSKDKLSGLYSGVVESFNDKGVENRVVLDATTVTLYFEDGLKNLDNVWVQGSWGSKVYQMFDDGTNGDSIAGDKNWTAQIRLVDEQYLWDVISREVIETYDTTSVTDPETGIITQTISPVTYNNDSVISETTVLEFQVSKTVISGTTSYGIMNIDIVFNVTAEVAEQLYLMGIDDDWGEGILLEKVGNSNTYTVTLTGYSVGDVFSYNYRDGNNWENQTTQSRSYTVTDGENIINDSFGVFTHSKVFDETELKVYPNPVSNYLRIDGAKDLELLMIYNLSGQLIHEQTVSENSITIDVSRLKSGVYCLQMISGFNQIISKRLIKTN